MVPDRLRANRRLRYASPAIRTIDSLQSTVQQEDTELCYPCPPTFLLPISPAGHPHLAPQRHVGGSPLTQHTATRPRHRHTAYMAKTNEPYVGSSMKAPPRRRKAKIPMTTQPCHTLGRPQPQP